MNVTDQVIVDGLATIGWYHLPEEARDSIKQTLASLAGVPPDRWGRDDIEPWRPDEGVFALHTHVGPDHLIVLFRPEEERIRLRHMVLKETIDRYFTPKNGE